MNKTTSFSHDDSNSPTETTALLNEKRRWCVGLAVRHVVMLMGFFGIVNVYAMRVNLSVAMVAMVNKTKYASPDDEAFWDQECPELLTNPGNGTYQEGEFNWDTETEGRILGAFFYGYIITQIPGGILAEKFGAKWLFGIGVFITSIFTVLTPVAVRWGGASALIAVRVIEGLGEGVTFPAMNTILAKWSPIMERSRNATLAFTGSQVGTIFALFISGFLSKSTFMGGWPSVFYVFGILGCVWFVAWCFIVYENPSNHPTISKEELLFIDQNQEKKQGKKASIPWKAILTSLPVWFLALTHFGQNWGFYTMLTELPSYLDKILHFDLKKNGVLSSIPYLAQAIFAWIASYLADRMRSSGRMSITTIRKILNSIGFFGPAICTACIALAGCRPTLIILLLSLGMGLNGFIYSGFNVTHVDMSPQFAGTLMGITNCFATLSGFLAPAAVGKITATGQTLSHWGVVFLVASIIYFVAGLLYDVFCSAELQPWDTSVQPSQEQSPPPQLEEKPKQTEDQKNESTIINMR